MSKFYIEFSVSNSGDLETDGENLEEELDDWLLAQELVYTKTDQIMLDWISCNRCNNNVNLLESPVYADRDIELSCPNCDAVSHQ